MADTTKTLAQWWREELETASKELDTGRVDEAKVRLDLAYHIESSAQIVKERAPARAEIALKEVLAAAEPPAARVGFDTELEQAREDLGVAEAMLARVRAIAGHALDVEEPF